MPRITTVVPGEPGHASGGYLAFLRPGDELVPHTVTALVAALDASGSDLALATGGSGPGSVAGLSDPLTGVTADEVPALLDHFEPSAVLWRRAFWELHGLQWPDAEWAERAFVSRAVLRSTAVDVVPEPATAEQAGQGGPDELQRRLRTEDLPALADRLDSLHEVARAIGSGQLRRHWESSVLEPEMRAALNHLGMAEPEVRDRLVERVAQVLEEAGPDLEAGARAVHRLQYHLARRRLVPQLLQVVKADRFGELTLLRAVRRGRRYYGDYPFRSDRELAVPREVYRLDRELGVRARVERVWFEGATLHLRGYAYLPYVDAGRPGSGRLRLELVRGGQKRRAVRLRVERERRPDVTADAREAAYCYEWSGFRASVPVSALRGRKGWSRGVWRLEARLSDGRTRRSRVVTSTAPGQARHPEALETEGVRIVPATGRGAFAVEVDMLPAAVTAARVERGRLVVEGEVRRRVEGAAGEGARLTVTRASDSSALEADGVSVRPNDAGGLSFAAALSLSDLRTAAESEAAGEGRWTLRLTLPGGRPVRLRAGSGLQTLRVEDADAEVVLDRTPHGRVSLTCRAPRPVVESARWAGDALELSGRWPKGCADRLLLVARDGTRTHRLASQVSGDRFRLSFLPGAVTTLAGTLPLTQGSWLPVVRTGRDERTLPLAADTGMLATLPLRHSVGAKTFELTEDSGNLELLVGPDLLDDERGAPNQHRLHLRDFPRFAAAGLRDEVLFESYESRAYADNARAILEELTRRGTGLRCRWVVVDGQAELPEDVEPVRRGSRDYYEALARARYVVVPNYRHLEQWLETPTDQVVVQTWHGAPYKKIGLDNQRGKTFSARNYVDMLRRESARWDYLLSPNPPSSPILREAFAFDGELLETGYPRTDVFHSADRDRIAANVRDRLRLPDGKRVVLYAPTMRDDRSYGANRFSLDMRLDLEAASERLGDDHVLLVRRHAKVADDVRGADGDFARDVSLWPDVNELMLATDVLVTDYSSLLFDFANTGRPMLFFTYDLEDYRDRLRGLYFDPARMPGPHLRTSAELVEAIRDVDAHHAAYAPTYRRFVDDFCPWDDGKAGRRLVDRVFADYL